VVPSGTRGAAWILTNDESGSAADFGLADAATDGTNVAMVKKATIGANREILKVVMTTPPMRSRT
jgi:hypothetical protein